MQLLLPLLGSLKKLLLLVVVEVMVVCWLLLPAQVLLGMLC